VLYVLIMYCTGVCPGWMPPPSGVLFFSKLADCRAEIAKHQDIIDMTMSGPDGKAMPDTRFQQTCSTMYAEPKQLDRILVPSQLEQLLKDYNADRAAHPTCVATLKGQCVEHDPRLKSDKCNGSAICVADGPSFTSIGSCRVGEFYTWPDGATAPMCENPKTRQLAPPCDKQFAGRCAITEVTR
jgi:hypothetical protein